MKSIRQVNIKESYESVYAAALEYHQGLELDLYKFITHLDSVINKYLGENASPDVAISFIKKLYINDFFLAVACAEYIEAACDRFYKNYKSYILKLAISVCPSNQAAEQLAGQVLGDLFLPDRSGRCRLASYEGRSSLAAWLHIVVSHRAFNERERKCNCLEPIDCVPEIADSKSVHSIEASLRASQYENMIWHSLNTACKLLEYRERLMLFFRYDQGLQVSQIARLFSVSPAKISRDLQWTYKKVLNYVEESLATEYGLQRIAIEECMADLRENPSYSILSLIRQNLR
jgi:RNA polymerase sigma factor (sigma-70 family)